MVLDLTWVRVNRRALKQDGGGAVTQRAVHHVAVSRYPADVRHAAEHVAVLVVKDVLKKDTATRRRLKLNVHQSVLSV